MEETAILTRAGFVLTTLLTIWFLYRATNNRTSLWGIGAWMIIVGVLGYFGFYRVTGTIPPRFIFLLGPGLLFVLFFVASRRGQEVSARLRLDWLTVLHVVRVPVEIVLYFVFLEGLIPEVMTFEGYNLDILSGLSAPLVYYAVFVKQCLGNRGLLIWNILCLGLLLNILLIAVLSAQTPLQQWAFEQPNVGVTYFPFVWLPAVVVPIVLYAHLASIQQLLRQLRQA